MQQTHEIDMAREKRTAVVAIKTSEEVSELLRQKAASCGLTASEYGHLLLQVNLLGRDHVDKLHDRLMNVVSEGVNKDLPAVRKLG